MKQFNDSDSQSQNEGTLKPVDNYIMHDMYDIDADTQELTPPSYLTDCNDDFDQESYDIYCANSDDNDLYDINDNRSHININQKFLGNSLLDAISSAKCAAAKSPTSTGKTTAIKKIIAENVDSHVVYVTPRIRLNASIAGETHLNTIDDLNKLKTKKEREECAKRLILCPQTAAKILNEFKHISYLMIFDESEAITDLLVSNATENKIETIARIKRACNKASNIVVLDAFLSDKTKALLSALNINDVTYINNSYKRYADYKFKIIKDEKFKERKEKLAMLQHEAIENNENIYITSSTKAYADNRENTLRELYPDISMINVTSEYSKEVNELMSNPAKIKDYQVIIGSPAVSIGVSFDIHEYVKEIFGCFPNFNGTGGSQDAFQSLARIRNPINKNWTVALDDEKQVVKNTFNSIDDVAKAISDRVIKARCFAGTSSFELTDDEKTVIDLFAKVKNINDKDKNNYNKNLLEMVKDVGFTIEYVDASKIGDTHNKEHLKEIDEQIKADKKEQIVLAKTTSTKIDEDEYKRLTALLKFQRDVVTKENTDSLERYKFERNFNIDCDTADESTIEKCLKLDEDSVISKLVRSERVQAPLDFTKKYLKALDKGVGNKASFKVDILSKKLSIRLEQKLYKYALDYVESSEEYSNKMLSRSNFMRFIDNNRDEIVLSELVSLPLEYRKKGAVIMNRLLEKIGYSHKAKKKGKAKGKGKRDTIYTVKLNADIEELRAKRKIESNDWVTRTENIIVELSNPVFHAQIIATKNETVAINDEQANALLVEQLYADADELVW